LFDDYPFGPSIPHVGVSVPKAPRVRNWQIIRGGALVKRCSVAWNVVFVVRASGGMTLVEQTGMEIEDSPRSLRKARRTNPPDLRAGRTQNRYVAGVGNCCLECSKWFLRDLWPWRKASRDALVHRGGVRMV
jgi:hypothetical protein